MAGGMWVQREHSHRGKGMLLHSTFWERRSDPGREYFRSRRVKIRPKYCSPFPFPPTVVPETLMTMKVNQTKAKEIGNYKIAAMPMLRCSKVAICANMDAWRLELRQEDGGEHAWYHRMRRWQCCRLSQGKPRVPERWGEHLGSNYHKRLSSMFSAGIALACPILRCELDWK